MDGDQIVHQESQSGQEDDFLAGWAEAGPGLEEAAPAEARGSQAGAQQEGEGAGKVPTGGAEASAADAPGGEGSSAGKPAGQESGAEPSAGALAGQEGDGGEPPSPPPKTWTLNHMGQAVTISEADVPFLAQKALDYDRIRASYDEARPVMDLFRGFAQQAGLSVQEYVGRLRTQAKQMEGLDEQAARQAVEMEDREARISIKEAEESRRQKAAQRVQAAQAQRQERINADVQEFISVFPNAALDFKSIPQEVWDAVNGGMSLVAAYARYNSTQTNAAAQKAEEERQRQDAVQRQNSRNAAASTGSMKSAGQNHGPKDPFLEGWDE